MFKLIVETRTVVTGGCFAGVKQPDGEAAHLYSPSAEVMSVWIMLALHGVLFVQRSSLTCMYVYTYELLTYAWASRSRMLLLSRCGQYKYSKLLTRNNNVSGGLPC
jgi:hypothetical protein